MTTTNLNSKKGGIRGFLEDGLTDRTLAWLHPVLILVTALLFVGCGLHSALWFDEAFSVGAMSHGFADMIRYLTADVHPHLYYILLWFFTRVFGTSVIAMRMFSVIFGVLFVSVGYTHIRRDFGARAGFWYSVVAAALAPTLTYSLQIRMYTLVMYFLALTGVYAYRIARGDMAVRNKILFVLFSVASAYTHYFGLFAVVVLNLFLLVRTVRRKMPLRGWLIPAAVQLLSYIPGALVMLSQTGEGYDGWQSIVWPNAVFDFASFPLLGSDRFDTVVTMGGKPYRAIGCVFVALFVAVAVLFALRLRKGLSERAESESGEGSAPVSFAQAAKWAIMTFVGLVLLSLAVSLFRVVYYVRYTVVVYAFLAFALAFLVCSFKKGWQRMLAGLLLVLILAINVGCHINVAYDPSSSATHDYLAEEVKEGDIFVFDDCTMFAFSVRFPEYDSYFYNQGHWDVQVGYRTFGPKVHILDEMSCPELDGFTGRIWVLGGRGGAYNYLMGLDGCREVSCVPLEQKYYNYHNEIILLEKE